MNFTQAFGPGFQTGDVINADAQNLGIGSGVLGPCGLERLDLTRSNRGPGQREERQYQVLAAQLA
jgi:hypothetical protein